MELTALLPLLGVGLGWGLKSLSDYLTSRKTERQTFRRATFYLLKSFKALLDYDRGTEYFRRSRPPIDEFEPWRARLQARFREAYETNSATTNETINLLASVDPTGAARLHNTLVNIELAFRRNLGEVAEASPPTYAEMLKTLGELVAFTLHDLKTAALSTARKCGPLDARRVRKWIDERERGNAEFVAGMDEQKAVRDRAVSIPGRPPAAASK